MSAFPEINVKHCTHSLVFCIAFMMTLGDIVSQQAVEKKGFENHDFKRSFRMTIYGALIGGPVIGTWFGFINRAITIKNKWTGKFLIGQQGI